MDVTSYSFADGDKQNAMFLIEAGLNQNKSYLSGDLVEYTGKIKMIGEKFENRKFKNSLLKEFTSQGIEILFTYPNLIYDVSSDVTLIDNGSREVIFKYKTAPLNTFVIPEFNVKVMSLKKDKEKIKKLSQIKEKLFKRIVLLNNLLNKKDISKTIVQRHIDELKAVLSKLEVKMQSYPFLMAENAVALQLNNEVAKKSLNMTIIDSVKFQLEAQVGSLIQGEKANIAVHFQQVGVEFLGKKSGHGEDDKMIQLILYHNNKEVKKSLSLDLSTSGSQEFLYTSAALQEPKVHDFFLKVYRLKKKSNQWQIDEAIAEVPLKLPVLQDTQAPIWLLSDVFPNANQKHLKKLSHIHLVATDSFGRLDKNSVDIKIEGAINDAQTSYSKNITVLLKSEFSNNNSQVSFDSDAIDLEEGLYYLKAALKDLVGQFTIPHPLTIPFRIDRTPPVIQMDATLPVLTNQKYIFLPIRVLDLSPVQVKIFVNHLLTFTTSATQFSYNIPLSIEGVNTVQIAAIDQAGNEALGPIFEVRRDTTAPVLTAITPSSSSKIFDMVTSIHLKSNEELSLAQIDLLNLTLDPSLKIASGTYVFANRGEQDLQIKIKDLAGNETLQTVHYVVGQKLLTPELVTVAPAKDGQHLAVIGQLGSTKGLSKVVISYGFLGLNTEEVISDADGGFKVFTDLFSTATLKVFDAHTNETAQMNLSFVHSTTIAGIVMDTNGNPLPQATVGILNTNVKVQTDEGGVFVINAGRTGDQTLVIDGSTILQTSTGAHRKFSQVSIAVNIGIGQKNTLDRPIYLHPILQDGSETVVTATADTVVENPSAPGVSIDIPAETAQFPNGLNSGVISMALISSDKATISTPPGAVPTKVLALEPSGLSFKERVEVQMPNDNELPAGTEMVILSMNSKEGIWEVDGFAKVTEDGQSIKSKTDQGISHFSLIYMIPARAYIEEVKNPLVSGINISERAMTTSIQMPSYKTLGQKLTPSLSYNSSWANPVAFVSQSFDIPTQQIEVKSETTSTSSRFTNINFKSCSQILGITINCEDNHGVYLVNAENNDKIITASAYKPEKITAQLYVSSLSTDGIQFGKSVDPYQVININDIGFKSVKSPLFTFTGLPNRSLISFSVPLKDPETSQYLETGLYPSLTRYGITLKNMTITTVARTSKVSINGGESSVNVSYFKREDTQILNEIFPSDLQSNLIVQNKIKSPFGRGWHLNLAQKIINPKNNLILIEEANGQVSTYALNNTMSTVMDGHVLGVSFSQITQLNRWPKLLTQKFDSLNGDSIVEVDALLKNQTSIVSKGVLEQMNGQLGNSLEGKCLLNNYAGTFDTHFHSYKYKADIGQIIQTSDGVIYGTNQMEHSIFKLDQGVYTKLAGAEDIDERSEKLESDQVNLFCLQKYGTACGQPVFNSTRNCSEVIPPTCPPGAVCKPIPLPVFIRSVGHRPAAFFNGDDVAGLFGSPQSKNIALNQPQSIVLSPDGFLVVADTGNNRVRKINLATQTITTLAGNGFNTDTGDNGLAIEASLFHPKGLAYDSLGNLYITTENGYIRKVDTAGMISTLAGLPLGQGGVLSNEIAAKKIALVNPTGIIFDDINQFIYVADTGNNRVVRINLDNMMASNVAGNGSCQSGSAAENQAALNTAICQPTQIGLDEQKNLIIVDNQNNKIKKVQFNSSQGASLAYLPTSNDLSQLIKNDDGTWVRIYRDQSKSHFNAEGLQIDDENRIGQKVTYTYNDQKQLIEMIDPTQQILRINYIGEKVSQIIDPAGRVTQFNFTDQLLTSIMYPDGSMKFFTYNPQNGLLTSELNEENQKTTYLYNLHSRLSSITDAQNNIHRMQDQISQSIAIVDTENVLNNSGSSPSNINNSVIDPTGSTTYFVQNTQNLITQIKNAKGVVTKIVRDQKGNIAKTITPNLHEMEFQYDPITNDLLKKKDALTQLTEEKMYNSFGQVIATKDIHNNIKSNQYSATTGLLEKEIFPTGNQIEYFYNLTGQVNKKIERSATGQIQETQFEYDTKGNLSKILTPDGKVIENFYDLSGNLIKNRSFGVTTADINETLYEYDELNRLTKVTSPKAEITQYTYDKLGHILEIKDPKNRITQFQYDNLGRLISKFDPNVNGTYSFTYDSKNNLTTETLPDGVVKRYQYDELNQMTQLTTPENTFVYSYDDEGQTVGVKDRFSMINYIRNIKGLVEEENFFGYGIFEKSFKPMLINYKYNLKDQLTKVTIDNADQMNYAYDQLGRLIQITNPFGEVFNYDFDDTQRLSRISRPGGFTEFKYNLGGGLASINHTINNLQKSKFDYQYDLRNFITQKSSLNHVEDYSYDTNGQLTKVQKNNIVVEQFTYDGLGNRITDKFGQYIYEPVQQTLNEDSQFKYIYDKRGNLILKTPKDLQQKAYAYQYNSLNQLVKLTVFDKPLGTVIDEYRYNYDPIGRRYSLSRSFRSANELVITEYSYIGDQVIYEYHSTFNSTRTGTITDKVATYTYGLSGVDDILSVRISEAGASIHKKAKASGSYYFLKDHLGSITEIADSFGNIVQKYDYSSFGVINKIQNESGLDMTNDPYLQNQFTYTGREYDAETGLYYYRARYYDSSLGRFLQIDPDPGKVVNPITVVNKYIYTGNKPVMFTDPNGKFEIISAFISIILGAFMEGLKNWINTNQSVDAFINGAKDFFHYGYKPFLAFIFGGFSDEITKFITVGRDPILDPGSYLFTKTLISVLSFDSSLSRITTSNDERTFWNIVIWVGSYNFGIEPGVDYGLHVTPN